MANCLVLHDRIPWEGFPRRQVEGPCFVQRGPVCRPLSCHRYRCQPAKSTPEGCSGYLGPPGLCGFHDTNSKRSDRISPDHVAVGEQSIPAWEGCEWPPDRSPKTSPSRAFGSYERWCLRSTWSDANNPCIDTCGEMGSATPDHGHSGASETHRAICV